ncbi:MAG TPA: holo-ACP synthase [Rudaea sp.]|nr:holo-ACP synthase [Rudaea sp.]
MHQTLTQEVAAAPSGTGPVRLGFDLVQISRIEDSVRHFGEAFEQRLFTPDERAYAHDGTGVAAQRLAARFAAKEAVIKALRLAEAGIDWRDIEVCRLPDGDCSIRLHGRARELAQAQGARAILVSLSHDGDYAGAVANVLGSSPTPTEHSSPPPQS